MSLISTANMKLYTDHLAAAWRELRRVLGKKANQSSPVAGTVQNLINNLLTLIVSDVDDYEQQQDMSTKVFSALAATNIETASTSAFKSALDALDAHCAARGPAVDSAIVSFSTFLNYYNGGSGGAAFANMVSDMFGDMWFAAYGTRLPKAGVASPAIHPNWDAAEYGFSTNGMGLNSVGGSFTDGDSTDSTNENEVLPLVEVTIDFAGGSSAPQISIAGVDNTGATDTTWDVTLGATNPTALIAASTITPAVSAPGKQTVAVSSTSGIVIGSVLGINIGEDDEEHIVVENIAGSDITAAFRKTHAAGAAITGNTTVATTPSVSGRRLRDCTGVTITTDGHSAGAVRCVGRLERVPS